MKNIKNIVIACDYAYFEGGAANVALQTVISLARYTDMNIYCFAGSGTPSDELLKCGAKVICLNLPDLLNNPNKMNAIINGIYNKNVYKEMTKLLSSLDINQTVVHIHTWTKILSSSVFKACEDLGVNTFLTIHDYFLACPNGACFNYSKEVICQHAPLSIKCILSNCDSRNYCHKIWRVIRQVKQNSIIRNNKNIGYIFISNFQKKQLLKRIPDIRQTYLLKNPIIVKEKKYIEPEKNKEYVYIGRLSVEKGVKLFCEAITLCGVKGVVMGTGILEDELKSLYPNIEFIGWCNKSQINNRLTKARALIFPTLWYEGSPLTVPEVQAQAIPCIITNCSSATDDVINGFNGEIVEPNLESIVESLKRFENDRYVKILSNNTRNNWDKNRSNYRVYVDKLLQIYKGE